MDYSVDPDITIASTLDSAFYRDEAAYAQARERVFARTWQWLGDLDDVAAAGSLSPRDLLPGLLDEPLLLARDATGELRCLSNVCTHRGNILVAAPCQAHGDPLRLPFAALRPRRPHDVHAGVRGSEEFSVAARRPAAGAVRRVGATTRSPRSIRRRRSTTSWATLQARIGWMPVDTFRHDPARDRDYIVQAHWALYVENYLEGLHIPFVHPG